MSFKGKSFKQMKCRDCDEIVEKVDVAATAVVCWRCASRSVSGCAADEPEEEPEKSKE